MPGTWCIAVGNGVFVTGGYMTIGATVDFGKSITTFSLCDFKKGPRTRKLVTHHVGPVYCGDASGRFLEFGNDRSTENLTFGNLDASENFSKIGSGSNPNCSMRSAMPITASYPTAILWP